ncbi:hypothetical protein [uncultured Phenylobacterium sp.]|uniref:hypothetical protein n=1 Tax=uncultured Phenylobacterium sp. TaxID=349273 RepID=UPI0026005EDE|nr:hypothetical protein [uncultured Phenylobacterium sp.]
MPVVRSFPTFKGADWLAQLTSSAVKRGACLTINCSTCGATPFKQALWAQATAVTPLLPEDELARQLATLPSDTAPEALRFVIDQLYKCVGQSGLDRLATSFADTPAGEEYRRMQAHAAAVARQRADNAHRNSPDYAEERRAERAAQHAERLAAKAMRDAARRDGGAA